VKISEKKIGGF